MNKLLTTLLCLFVLVTPFREPKAQINIETPSDTSAESEHIVPDIISEHVADAEEVGAGLLKFLFKDVYTARLYAPNGEWTGQAPYALELTYDMGLKGLKIAERSVDEMRKIGYDNDDQLNFWRDDMTRIFPDVKDGTILTGIYTNNQTTLFYEGSNLIGEVGDPEFGVAFFNIWLSEKTSEPELRQALLGR